MQDPTSDVAENKELVRRYYEDVVSTGDLDAVSRFVGADYVEVHAGERHELGLEGAIEHVRGVRRTYPDLRLVVEQQIAEAEWVVSRITMRGTHAGEWLGMTPTGKVVTVTAVNVDRVVGGRIVEHGGAADLLGPLLAAGAIEVVGNTPRRSSSPPPRPAPARGMVEARSRPVEWTLLLEELDEAREHLQELVERMNREGRIDEEDYAVRLGHVYAHLNRCWNGRDRVGEVSDEEFAELSGYPDDLEPIG